MVKRWMARPDTKGRQIGWAVAAVAVRDTPEKLYVRLRPFTVGMDVAATKEEAEAWTYAHMTELWTPDVGWIITVEAVDIRASD